MSRVGRLDGGTRPSRFPKAALVKKRRTIRILSFACVLLTMYWLYKSILIKKREPSRCNAVLFSHFYNEELLMPFWIDQHRHMFDDAMLVDFGSTDRSVDILRERAPAGWKVYHWGNNFDFAKFRTEFMIKEKLFPGAWKIFLTTTEFLAHDDLCTLLQHASVPSAFRFRSYVMVGDDSQSLVENVPLLQQRSLYTVAPLTHEVFHVSAEHFNASSGINKYYSRIMHSFDSMEYRVGVHDRINMPVDNFSDEGFIVKFAFTPWPEVIDRKIQIASRIPQELFEKGMATHHQDNLNVSRMKEQREYLLQYTDDLSKPTTAEARAADHRMFARIYTP